MQRKAVLVSVIAAVCFTAACAGTAAASSRPLAPPWVESVSPRVGAGPGSGTIVIRGTGFVRVQEVSVAGLRADILRVRSSRAIVTDIPDIVSAGDNEVRVRTAHGWSAAGRTWRNTYDYRPGPPTVSGLSADVSDPSQGWQLGTIFVYGTNFVTGARVTFGGLGAAVAESTTLSSTVIRTQIPSNVPFGVSDVQVSDGFGTSQTIPADRYDLLTPAPTVTGLSQTQVPIGGGEIDVYGTNFYPGSFAVVGRNDASSTVLSPDEMRIEVPPDNSDMTTTDDLVVFNPFGISATSAVDEITYSPWDPAKSTPTGSLVISCVDQSACYGFEGIPVPRVPYTPTSESDLYTFDGESWTETLAFDTQGSIEAVSCASTGFCGAIDQHGHFFTTQGSGWVEAATSPLAGTDEWQLSCSDDDSCHLLVDDDASAIYSNGSWINGGTPPSQWLPSAACVDASFCLVGDFLWSGTTWSSLNIPLTPGDSVTSTSCPTSTFCRIADSNGDIYTWDGSVIGGPIRTLPANSVTISCATTSQCIYVFGDKYITATGSVFEPIPSLLPSGEFAPVELQCIPSNACIGIEQYSAYQAATVAAQFISA